MNVEWVYRLGSHSGINSASILYDQSQIAHQMDILIWIALDRNEVRALSGLQESAIPVAAQTGTVGGGGNDRIHSGHPQLTEQFQFPDYRRCAHCRF